MVVMLLGLADSIPYQEYATIILKSCWAWKNQMVQAYSVFRFWQDEKASEWNLRGTIFFRIGVYLQMRDFPSPSKRHTYLKPCEMQ